MTSVTKMSESPESLLTRAQDGDHSALNDLLKLYLSYLRLLAQVQTYGENECRVDPSELAQQTLFEAYRDFPEFTGRTEREFLGWLRRILARNLADGVRYQRAQKRSVQRQQSLDEKLDQSASHMETLLAAGGSTPSQHASRQESAIILANALERQPDEYREVIVLRHLMGFSFPEIATRLGKSPHATRRLWARALERLRKDLLVLE